MGFWNFLVFRTDFLWAKAMGYTGEQMDDSDGVSVGNLNYIFWSIYFTFSIFQANQKSQLLNTST